MSLLGDAIDGGEFAVTCELNPPKGTELAPMLAKAEALAGRVHAFNVTDSHAALMAMCPLAAARRLLDTGAEPILQITTRDRNRIALQGDLLGASALGIENVVFMGGDPPSNGDHPEAKPVFDVYSSAILGAAHGLNEGHDMSGAALDGATRLVLGAVVNPGAADLDDELKRLAEKLEAGARFFQTQAIYDAAAFERFARRVEGLGAPLLAGIIPLKSARMAAWMNEHVPGIVVPEAVVREIDRASDRTDAALEIAARTIRTVRDLCRGVHVMAIGWEQHVPDLLERAEVPPLRG
jgi:5,10-methylenetetrahydrofolate reductase